MEVQTRGRHVLLQGGVEDGGRTRRSERNPSVQPDTLCLHSASAASRPVMTAPPVAAARDIWLLWPDSARAATSTSNSSGCGMRRTMFVGHPAA